MSSSVLFLHILGFDKTVLHDLSIFILRNELSILCIMYRTYSTLAS